MRTDKTQGEAITIKGTVYDGAGEPLTDAMVEAWQADTNGQFGIDPEFTGFGRSAGDMDTGAFTFETIKPGSVAFPDGRPQAPHITFWIVARGINLGLQTRMYFADENNSNDPVLNLIDDQTRIPTLLAHKHDGVYRIDIHLQGSLETNFFDA
jgi:protocatechuate 3,4-dioxygenase alpha subunit